MPKNSQYYFSNALRLGLYLKANIVCVRFDKMEKRLISSYDEINDTFVGKLDGEHGYCADYGISEGVYLGINNSNLPTSIFVPNASEVFNTSKETLESADVKININCNGGCLCFDMCIENSRICSIKCRNDFGIPKLECLMDSNI
jgi:hypothetical protein